MDKTVEFWLDPRMPYIETRRACQSRVCYQSHSHPTFSIGAIDEGESTFSSYFAQAQVIQKGSLVVIPAHVEHSCNPQAGQAWSYQMLHLDASWLSVLLDELQAENIFEAIPQWQPYILQKPDLYKSFCQLNQLLFDSSALIIEKEQGLIEYLTQILFPYFRWQPTFKPRYGQSVFERLVEQCVSAETFIGLDDLAQSVGMSRYAVIRLFKKNIGITPHAFQLNLKIQQARQLLRQGQHISQIAHTLGFIDQSHFHKVFKQYVAVTPKQFQEGSLRTFIQ
ncbi:AraC family transcriptional regulator [Acinetobacter sp. MD2(2019)]|uniref:AraC family transcriptional regulator n=1 Tax=Acinetobacter sp. MD2(2019) TaxID=2605273 RepID=UPI002D1F64DD|nr:AraC family transcriptional regulator [Acinetobacter sp. MD2(2019)]MEB3754787.1 AraC family transcriptional regulator [Acinetobacter sp. MD2(2019)]